MRKNNYNNHNNQFDDGYSELDFENFDKIHFIMPSLKPAVLAENVLMYWANLNPKRCDSD